MEGQGTMEGNPEVCLLWRSGKTSWRRQTASKALQGWLMVEGEGGPVR